MAEIPDITESERWMVQTTLRERYGREMEIKMADAEIRLHASDRELTSCPVIFWNTEDGCNFVIFKSVIAAIDASFSTGSTSRWVRGWTSTTTCPNAPSPCSRPRRTIPPSSGGTCQVSQRPADEANASLAGGANHFHCPAS
jgi:hypothetical protein